MRGEGVTLNPKSSMRASLNLFVQVQQPDAPDSSENRNC